jgi:transposase-like protein
MGKPQRRFGKEFAAEAVRLVEVSGRTQREIAMDLGVGLSTLRRGWPPRTRACSRPRTCARATTKLPDPDRRGTEMAHEFAIERWDAAALSLTTRVVLPQMFDTGIT